MRMPKQLSCPACGGPLTIESAFTTLLTCPFCGQSLYVHDTGVDPTGHTAKLAEYPSRFSIGGRGTVKGRAFKTLGRMRFETDDGFWDEWFVQFDEQQVGWIEENEGAFTLTFKNQLTSAVPPFERVRVGSFIQIGDERIFVSAKGQAHVAGAEGEVAMPLPPGLTVSYLNGSAGHQAVRLLMDEHSITLYRGEPLEFNDIVMQEA